MWSVCIACFGFIYFLLHFPRVVGVVFDLSCLLPDVWDQCAASWETALRRADFLRNGVKNCSAFGTWVAQRIQTEIRDGLREMEMDEKRMSRRRS